MTATSRTLLTGLLALGLAAAPAEAGKRVLYVTERCVMKLKENGLLVTEIAPGVDLERDIIAQVEIPLNIAPDLRTMPEKLFRPEPIGLGAEAA